MMGKTHALGGVAALCAYGIVTGSAATIPPWGYAIAAASALVPDADNGSGSMLNRWYLSPLKVLSLPLWGPGKPAHRTRTHSLIATVGWVGLMLFWWACLNFLLGALGARFTLSFNGIVAAAGTGYLSHLVLDMLNIPGIQLLWPLPIMFSFPPTRAHGVIPGRFNAGSRWEFAIVWLPLVGFVLWYAVANATYLATAVAHDQAIPDLLTFVLGLVRDAVVNSFSAAMG